jgi:hypothetical protein
VETARLVLSVAAPGGAPEARPTSAPGEPRPPSTPAAPEGNAPAPAVEEWPELRELVPGRLADPSWDTALAVLHGGVNRAWLSFAVLDADREGAFVVRTVNATPGTRPTWPAARPPWRSCGPSTGARDRLDRRWPPPGG